MGTCPLTLEWLFLWEGKSQIRLTFLDMCTHARVHAEVFLPFAAGIRPVWRWGSREPHPPGAGEAPTPRSGLRAVGREHLRAHAEEPAGGARV